jgi:hypothetical protein
MQNKQLLNKIDIGTSTIFSELILNFIINIIFIQI